MSEGAKLYAQWIRDNNLGQEAERDSEVVTLTPKGWEESNKLKSEPLSTVCAYDLDGKPVPRRQWLVDGVFPHLNVALLGGDGGLGKTVFALMLGTSLSARLPWLGFQTMQGPFLYIGAEDDADEIHRRLIKSDWAWVAVGRVCRLPLRGARWGGCPTSYL